MATAFYSPASTLEVPLANYRSAIATAEAVRANGIRVAQDSYEDAISLAGLNEVQTTNTKLNHQRYNKGSKSVEALRRRLTGWKVGCGESMER